jgi:ubiquinone/menaquinone biosynthesis C-methylase UbiE
MNQDKVMALSGSAPYFDQVAEDYASWYHLQSPGGHALRVRQRRVVELLDERGGKVLDVGCGPGVLVRELLHLGYKVWGVDAAPRMIERCRKDFTETDRAHFAVCDATSLDFPDRWFDAVICMGVIDRIQAHESAIMEMIRVVRKDGTLLITFPNLLSPYAAWRNFVFYPAVSLLRPIYYGLAGRRQPPTPYDLDGPPKLRSLFSSLAKLPTPRSTAQLMSRYGTEVTDIAHFYFNVFLSPLDELFPRWTLRVTEKLERLRGSRLRWLGAGFIVKAVKTR